MTNDLEYAKHISKIHRENAKLDSLSADKKVNALIDTLADIENAARQAAWRLLELQK